MLDDVKRALREPEYKWLHLYTKDGSAGVRGTISVPGDRYRIEIIFLDDYPSSLPQVRETGGRIPRISDRHVNPKDGTACLFIPDEWFVQRPDATFLTFLRRPVFNYFLSQKVFETSGTWPLGERRHGNDGLYDFYLECFGTSDPTATKKYLQCLSHHTIKGHFECPCGSGKRLRTCHLQQIRDLQVKIPSHVARSILYISESSSRY